MNDDWDRIPYPSPPCYPLRFGKRVFPRLSPEEEAAENKRHEELCKQIRKDHEVRCAEARRQRPLQQVKEVKSRLQLLRRFPSGKACVTSDGSCVYLMLCPSLGASIYKIGYTKDLNQRIIDLRQQVDRKIKRHTIYWTPVFLPLLEMALHRHFRHFRITRKKASGKRLTELFELPEGEVNQFEATTSAIEDYLLRVEILHLKSRLVEFQAECREMESREH